MPCVKVHLQYISYNILYFFFKIELDKLLANLYDDIVAHENRIIYRLRGFVMKYIDNITEPLKLIAMIDW